MTTIISTDLPIVPAVMPLLSGRVYTSQLIGTHTTLAVSIDTLYALPIWVPNTVTVGEIAIEVTSFAAGNVRLGIYRDDGGVPGSLVVDSGAISTGTSNGAKTATINQQLTPGLYWLAAVFDATPTIRAMANSSGNLPGILGFSSNTDTTLHGGVSVAFTYGALPSTFTGGSALMTGAVPKIMVSV